MFIIRSLRIILALQIPISLLTFDKFIELLQFIGHHRSAPRLVVGLV